MEEYRSMNRNRRMLLVHAHPDDETLTTGGTIATQCRAGVEVTVLTCTLGEEGEVIGDRWAGLAAGAADQLGGYRILELTRALAELGVPQPRFLGGAGRWRDSGMADTQPVGARRTVPSAFVDADRDEAVAALVAVLCELRPHVVISYDPRGGYGHPDHIQAHRVTTAAVAAAGAAGWDPPKFYWTVTELAAAERAINAAGTMPAGWRLPAPGELSGVGPDEVTTELDITAVLDVKRAAMRAHATQITVAPDGDFFALSNDVAQPILDTETFFLARGQLGPLGPDGREHDLFGGIE